MRASMRELRFAVAVNFPPAASRECDARQVVGRCLEHPTRHTRPRLGRRTTSIRLPNSNGRLSAPAQLGKLPCTPSLQAGVGKLFEGQRDGYLVAGAPGHGLGELHVARAGLKIGMSHRAFAPDGRDEIGFNLPAAPE
jgi:hypothetical protein